MSGPSPSPRGRLEVRDVTVSYDGVPAVSRVGFACGPGEVVGVVGPNGAGKSSLLKAIVGLLPVDAGEVRVDDRPIREVRRHVAYLPAEAAMFPNMRGREALAFFAEIRPSGDLARSLKLAERLELDLSRRVSFMSTGMKQKVSIARTVAHNPSIIIFDEPTVGLDVLNALEVQETIKELRSEGKTIIFSTHIMSEAERLCDRIAIINHGRLIACDTTAGLLALIDAKELRLIVDRDLTGVLAPARTDDLDTPPAEGEWPLREVCEHMLGAEYGFLRVCRIAIERQRAGKTDEPTDEEWSAASAPYLQAREAAVDPLESATINEIRNAFATIHIRNMRELGDVTDAEIDLPSWFWDGPMPIRFRLHRFEEHMRQHTIQLDKTLIGIGRAPTEAHRLIRNIYNGLADVESESTAAERLRAAVASTIADRAATL